MKRRRAFHGEAPCASEGCRNKAYWSAGDRDMCGVHSKSLRRAALPKNPRAKELAAQALADREKLVEVERARNAAAGRPGRVTCAQLRMMKPPPHRDGYLKVFPNYRHGGRRDGLGLPELSPMSLGPVDHGEPDYPRALNVENYHQGRKVFPCELDESGDPLPDVREKKRARYEDPVPHRHKFSLEALRKMAGPGGNKNVPAYSLHQLPDGTERRYDYVGSRYFYCRQYEILAERSPALAALRALIAGGTSVAIVGYDAHELDEPDREAAAVELRRRYEDESRPYGHEMVLATLLILAPAADRYPWNAYRRERSDLYE